MARGCDGMDNQHTIHTNIPSCLVAGLGYLSRPQVSLHAQAEVP